ncbi:hypothetical protein BDQ12DRAFT_666902 [Crucibulum laeve]|uniref:Uncharacterized protein n=1 Tax=Crucibulum laeve TaxID=68775 RepID=A0A5C3LWW9_9AGAR|nr:hypothetical protein BDQ12DRAFT_666902 [Crucibulum laeve]
MEDKIMNDHFSSFDSSVHISEEASNAATAVPWAIVWAIGIAGLLGWAINMSLAFCMGTDLQALYNSDQPMAQIFFNSFGQKGTLAIWAIFVLVQYMMGSSMLLAASRQAFAFSRDSALGLLVFAGDQAINAVFAISVTGLYIAYSIPIAARFIGDNDFKPGPFTLGIFGLPVAIVSVSFMFFMSVVFFFPTTPNPAVEDMNYTIVSSGIMYFPKYGGVHWFTGPVANINAKSVESSTRDSDEFDKRNLKQNSRVDTTEVP